MGHENGHSIIDFPKELDSELQDPQNTPKTCPLSHSSLSAGGEWDKRTRPTASPRARETSDDPRGLVEVNDPMGARDEEADDAAIY